MSAMVVSLFEPIYWKIFSFAFLPLFDLIRDFIRSLITHAESFVHASCHMHSILLMTQPDYTHIFGFPDT